MKIKSRTLYLKNLHQPATRHSYSTNRRFLARIRACSAEEARVLVKYEDDKKEYDLRSGKELVNDSGWYKNKAELLKTARAFLDEKD
tara:strand:+ start:283 stop:543 length:261 start_codon:yes stop_codon:yes gene_type:complete